MTVEIKVPNVGESVKEAVLAQWFHKEGDNVKKDEPLFLIETDKVTLEVVAEADGVLHIQVPEGQTVAIGTKVGTIDAAAAPKADRKPKKSVEEPAEAPGKEDKPEPKETEPEKAAPPKPAPAAPPPAAEKAEASLEPTAAPADKENALLLSPSVRRLLAEKKLDPRRITGTGPGGRITKGDVLLHLESAEAPQPAAPAGKKPPLERVPGEEPVEKKPMSPIRQRIAARLLEAKQNTAMLTTFNEIDMSRVMAFRAEYKEAFKARYGVSLGFMSFFIKACVTALKEIPEINAFIEGDTIAYHGYYHIGIAVGAERGLVVPVIRHADQLSFAELEQAIVDFVKKVKENRLQLADMQGGTFTITNGGVFGSLLSTPILNTPQSGILGMHKIEDRPVAIDGEVVIRPMMYVALSYDHRMVDGREAVTFLKRIKECVESPERMMVEI